MIVTKLSQIRSFGLFRDFAWDAGVPDLKRFNLVYGWNRSGKTTLSRALGACERKSTDFDQYPEGGVFEVVTDTGSKVRSSDLGECPFSIRVFNQDFIDENVVFYSSACNPIVYVSKEDIEANRQLEELSKATDGLVSVRDAKRKVRDGADKALVDFREATARTIKTTIGDHRVVDRYQYYDKAKLKQLTDSVDRAEFVAVLQRALMGLSDRMPREPMCASCKVAENECFYEHGVVCLGLITRSGCGAKCVSLGRPCTGCRGIAQDANLTYARQVLVERGLDPARLVSAMQLFNSLTEVAR